MTNEDFEKLEDILGYRFKNRSLLEEALTHPSFYFLFKPKVTYERLQFMGDAVLNLILADWVFFKYPNLGRGPLTRLRAANVDTEKLARAAICHDLHCYLRHKEPQLHVQIREFVEGMEDYPNHSNGLLDPPKVLADIVISVIGAIFVDSDNSLETSWEVFQKLADPLVDMENLQGKHPMAELHEFCRKRKLDLKLKDAWDESMNIEVLINGALMGSATYGHKKEVAMNRAAKIALDRLRKELPGSNALEARKAECPAVVRTYWSQLQWSCWFIALMLIIVLFLLMAQ